MQSSTEHENFHELLLSFLDLKETPQFNRQFDFDYVIYYTHAH